MGDVIGDGKVGVIFCDGRDYAENGWVFDENGAMVTDYDMFNIASRADALKVGVPASVLDLYEAAGRSYCCSSHGHGGGLKSCDILDWLHEAELYRIDKGVFGEALSDALSELLEQERDRFTSLVSNYRGFKCTWEWNRLLEIRLQFGAPVENYRDYPLEVAFHIQPSQKAEYHQDSRESGHDDGIQSIRYVFHVRFGDFGNGVMHCSMLAGDVVYRRGGVDYWNHRECVFDKMFEFCVPGVGPETVRDLIVNCVVGTVSEWLGNSLVWETSVLELRGLL